MEETVALKIIDIGIDSGISPLEEKLGLGKAGKRLVGIGVIHMVVLLLFTIKHRVVYHIASHLSIGPQIMGIPKDLWSPHTIYCAEIIVYIGSIGIAENLRTLTKIKGDRLPMDEVAATKEVDTVVVPHL
jgi:hypothetical protein